MTFQTQQPSPLATILASFWILVSGIISTAYAADANAVSPTAMVVEHSDHVDRWYTKHGHMTCLFSQNNNVPMAYVELFLNTGSSQDAGKWGLAYLTHQLLFSGTDAASADQISEQLQAHGAQISSETNYDFTLITLKTLTTDEHFEPAIQVWLNAIAQANFPEVELERQRQLMMANYRTRQDDHVHLANIALRRSMYGSQDPYAHYIDGEPDTLPSLKRSDILAFHQKYDSLDHATLLLAGDLTLDQAQALAEQIAKTLSSTTASTSQDASLPDFRRQSPRPPQVAVISQPTKQSTILLASPLAIQANDPDHQALAISNLMLGGLPLSAQLYQEVRQKKGYTYGIYSSIGYQKRATVWSITTQTDHQYRQDTLNTIHQVVKQHFQQWPPIALFEQARQSRLATLANSFADNTEAIHALTTLASLNLPIDYFEKAYRATERLVPEDVVRVHQRWQPSFNYIVYTIAPKTTAKEENFIKEQN